MTSTVDQVKQQAWTVRVCFLGPKPYYLQELLRLIDELPDDADD